MYPTEIVIIISALVIFIGGWIIGAAVEDAGTVEFDCEKTEAMVWVDDTTACVDVGPITVEVDK